MCKIILIVLLNVFLCWFVSCMYTDERGDIPRTSSDWNQGMGKYANYSAREHWYPTFYEAFFLDEDCDRGQADSCFSLGQIYLGKLIAAKGSVDVCRDIEYRIACEKHNVVYCYRRSGMLLYDEGLDGSSEEMEYLMRRATLKACAQGHTMGCMECIRSGFGDAASTLEVIKANCAMGDQVACEVDKITKSSTLKDLAEIRDKIGCILGDAFSCAILANVFVEENRGDKALLELRRSCENGGLRYCRIIDLCKEHKNNDVVLSRCLTIAIYHMIVEISQGKPICKTTGWKPAGWDQCCAFSKTDHGNSEP